GGASVHGGAGTLFLEAGSTWAFVCWVWLLDPLLELPIEPLPEPLLDPPLDAAMVHGGTTSVVMLLFSGTTSWFCCVWACCWLCGEVPPGVIRIVLTACGVDPPLEPPDEDPLEPPPEELDDCCDWHGWTATVCASAPFGTTIRL